MLKSFSPFILNRVSSSDSKYFLDLIRYHGCRFREIGTSWDFLWMLKEGRCKDTSINTYRRNLRNILYIRLIARTDQIHLLRVNPFTTHRHVYRAKLSVHLAPRLSTAIRGVSFPTKSKVSSRVNGSRHSPPSPTNLLFSHSRIPSSNLAKHETRTKVVVVLTLVLVVVVLLV